MPHPDPAQEFTLPNTPSEAALAEMFAEVLQLERVSVSENFFSLGGNSLTAIKVIGRIRAELGINLPLWVLFKSGSASALAEQIDQARNAPPPSTIS
jgi:acyl carrier protein